MAKKTLAFALLPLLLPVFCAAAEKPAQSTRTAQSLNADEDTLVNVSVKELHFNITPTFKFVLPDTSARIGIKQKIGESTLEGVTEYNYIYSKINYLIKYEVTFGLPLTASLYDDINFEKMYEEKKYLQRNRGYSGGVQTPKLFDFLVLKQEMKSEDFYFAHLNDEAEVSRGFLLLHESTVEMEWKGKERDAFRMNFNLDHSIPYQYSRYDFMFLNAWAEKIIETGDGSYLQAKMDLGYILEAANVPVWRRYSMGSYDRMIGYKYDEMHGNYMAFLRLKYDYAFLKKLNWQLFWFKITDIDAVAVADIGNAGSVWDMQDPAKYSAGAGLGFDVYVLFRNKTNIKLSFLLAQAIKQNYTPVFYFIYEV